MCDAAVSEENFFLQYVLDWFVTQGQVIIWRDDDTHCNYDKTVEWYDASKKTQGPESTNKTTVNVHCLASHENASLVIGRKRKEKDYGNVCLGR